MPCPLPVDPSLSTTTPTSSICTTLSMAPINLSLADHSQRVVNLPKPPTVVVAEGLPPVTCRVVDRIRKWEYVNLADLLGDHTPDHLTIINGQVIAVSTEGSAKKSRAITDILSWLQAYSHLSIHHKHNQGGSCRPCSSCLSDHSTIKRSVRLSVVEI